MSKTNTIKLKLQRNDDMFTLVDADGNVTARLEDPQDASHVYDWLYEAMEDYAGDLLDGMVDDLGGAE